MAYKQVFEDRTKTKQEILLGPKQYWIDYYNSKNGNVILGPALVIITKYLDGGVNVEVKKLEEANAQ